MYPKELTIRKSFFETSAYVQETKMENGDDSYGLVYNQIIHDIGSDLEVDIIWNKQDKGQWLIASNEHMDVYIQDHGPDYDKQLIFNSKSERGKALVNQVVTKYQGESDAYFI